MAARTTPRSSAARSPMRSRPRARRGRGEHDRVDVAAREPPASGAISEAGAGTVRYASTAVSSAPAASSPATVPGRPSAGRGKSTGVARAGRAPAQARRLSARGPARARCGRAARPSRARPPRGGAGRARRRRPECPQAGGGAVHGGRAREDRPLEAVERAQRASSGAGSPGSANAIDGTSRTSAPSARRRSESASSPRFPRVTTTVRRSRRGRRVAAPSLAPPGRDLALALAQDRVRALREQPSASATPIWRASPAGPVRSPRMICVPSSDATSARMKTRPPWMVAWPAIGTWQPPSMRARNPRSASTRTRVSAWSSAARRCHRRRVEARASSASAPCATAGASPPPGRRTSRARRGPGGGARRTRGRPRRGSSEAFRRRVSTLPRTTSMWRSGRSALSCALRRRAGGADPRALRQPGERLVAGRAERVARVLALGHRPDGESDGARSAGRSFIEWTAISASPARSASSDLLHEEALPPTSASRTSRIRSPFVTSSCSRTSRPGSWPGGGPRRGSPATWRAGCGGWRCGSSSSSPSFAPTRPRRGPSASWAGAPSGRDRLVIDAERAPRRRPGVAVARRRGQP